MSRVMNSAHEECSGNAACDQGDGPCIAWLRDRIDADTALLEACRKALALLLGVLQRTRTGAQSAERVVAEQALARLNERLEAK